MEVWTLIFAVLLPFWEYIDDDEIDHVILRRELELFRSDYPEKFYQLYYF